MCAVVQLGFLHRTLANSPVTYAVPTYQTLLTLLTILLGGIFGETRLYVSGGAEHQGPHGGGPVCVIYEV